MYRLRCRILFNPRPNVRFGSYKLFQLLRRGQVQWYGRFRVHKLLLLAPGRPLGLSRWQQRRAQVSTAVAFARRIVLWATHMCVPVHDDGMDASLKHPGSRLIFSTAGSDDTDRPAPSDAAVLVLSACPARRDVTQLQGGRPSVATGFG